MFFAMKYYPTPRVKGKEANMQIMVTILVIEFIIWGGLLVSSMSGRKPEKK